MKQRTFALYAVALLLGAQTPKITGSVNGRPIPDDYLNPSHEHLEAQFASKYGHNPSSQEQANVNTTVLTDWQCNKLHAMIHKAARNAGVQQFRIRVTQQDLAAASKTFPVVMGNTTNTIQLLLNALSSVYDKHENPAVVYNEMLAGKIPNNLWLAQLKEASTPESRSKLEAGYRNSIRMAQEIANSPKLEYWRSTVLTNKLNEAVDQKLALTDPTFRAHLQSTRVNQQGIRMDNWFTPQGRYLAQKRQEFWKAREAEVHVYLSDPHLLVTCGIAPLH